MIMRTSIALLPLLLLLLAPQPSDAFMSPLALLPRAPRCSPRGLGRLRAAMSDREVDCLIIGGGISGLTAGVLVSKVLAIGNLEFPLLTMWS